MERILEDLEKVNKYVIDYINQDTRDVYLDNIDLCVESSKKVASMDEHTYESPEWSRSINLNDSIDNVYDFLQSLNPDYANRFMNIIRMTDENGKPIVDFKSRRIYKDDRIYSNNVDQNGRVHIVYNEYPSDMFDILHEMLHKMNQADIVLPNGVETESTTREVYGETASILGEFLFGEWAVNKGIITQNDFDKVISKRVAITKDNAKSVLLQAKLIEMAKQFKEINIDNLYKEMLNEEDPLLRNIYEAESHSFANINDILNAGMVTLPRFQRYVTALYNVNGAMSKDNRKDIFIALQDELSNPESDINLVTPVVNNEIHSK